MFSTQILPDLAKVFCAVCILAAVVAWIIRWVRSPGSPLPENLRTEAKRNKITRLCFLAGAAILSRVLVFVLGALVQKIFHGGVESLPGIWGSWDAHHYLHIAQYGYTNDPSLGDGWLYIVFFPFYPLLVAGLGRVFGGGYFSAGVCLSWVSLVLASFVLYRLSEDEQPGSGNRAVKYLLIFPFTVFLGIPYTESLFILLSALTLLLIRRRQWLWAGVVGMFCALTRNVGVLLAFAYGIELLNICGFPKKNGLGVKENKRYFLKNAFYVLLIPLGTGIYLLINRIVYGDALMFLQIQSDHWYQNAQPFWLSIATTLQYALQNNTDMQAFLWIPQLVMMVTSLIALPFMIKKLRPMYGVYLLAYVLVVLSPSWLLSYGRYLMGAVPIYLFIAQKTKNKAVDILLTIFFSAVAVYLCAGYALGMQVL